MQPCRGSEILLAFEKARLSALQLITGKKDIGHSVVLIGMEKKFSRRASVAERKFVLGFGFGCIAQLKPSLFPAGHVAGLEVSAHAPNVENIPTPLLCFRHQS
jgi:hypothetical protein